MGKPFQTRRWSFVEQHLRGALALLDDVNTPQVEEYVGAKEYELAWDELHRLGKDREDGEFWRHMAQAARGMMRAY